MIGTRMELTLGLEHYPGGMLWLFSFDREEFDN